MQLIRELIIAVSLVIPLVIVTGIHVLCVYKTLEAKEERMFQPAQRMLATCTGIELMNESRDEPRQECQYSWGSHHKTCKAWYVYMTLETRKERRFQRVKAVYVTYTIGGVDSDYRQEKRQECPNSKQRHNTCKWNGNAWTQTCHIGINTSWVSEGTNQERKNPMFSEPIDRETYMSKPL